MKIRIFIIFYMALAAVFSGFASKLDDALSAYDAGDYSRSIEIYKDLMKEKGVSAPLLYNLGNAYVKTGDYGQAMLAYRRALNLDPSDRGLKENIAYVASKVDDNNKAEAKGKKISVSRSDRPFFSDLRYRISYSHLSDTWALWAGIAFVLTSICFAIYLFTSIVILRKIGFFGGFICLGISLITLCFALLSFSDRKESKEGIITAYKVNLFSEPDKGSKTNPVSLTRGTLLDVISEEKEEKEKGDNGTPDEIVWYKVRLNSDFAGWISSSDFELI